MSDFETDVKCERCLLVVDVRHFAQYNPEAQTREEGFETKVRANFAYVSFRMRPVADGAAEPHTASKHRATSGATTRWNSD